MNAATTRIAPTPSGFLHVGNAVNFVLTQWWALAHHARLLLRIDDFDTERTRAEYLADIFDTLAWLEVRVDSGPQDPRSFKAGWSMHRHIDRFRQARDRLLAELPDVVFVCRCSRTALDPTGRCVARCRADGLVAEPGTTVVRLSVPEGATVPLGGTRVVVPPGDHVLWRRDDLPSYQLGSVLTDEDSAVTTVIRGMDLVGSSALQMHLAELLPAPRFRCAQLIHHELLTAADGTKLSKSAGAQAHPLERTAELRERVHAWAERIGAPLGIGPA